MRCNFEWIDPTHKETSGVKSERIVLFLVKTVSAEEEKRLEMG